MTSGKRLASGAALLVLVGALTWARGWLDPTPPALSKRAIAPPPASSPASNPSRPAGLEPNRQDASAANAIRARLRELRAAKAATLAQAKATRLSQHAPSPLGAAAAAVRTMPDPVAVGDQSRQALGQYVRDTVRTQFIPMAGGCYEELLARDPRAKGVLNLSVVVGGHPSVGGVVERVSVLPDSTLTDEAFTTCMIQSMMALQFDAPPGGRDSIDFNYPFQLSPDEPEAGPAQPASSR